MAKLTSDGRPSARKRGYTKRWEKAARRFLQQQPVCAMLGKDPKCTGVAKHVDHKIPHGGNMRKFWDKRNWQGLCVGCHNRKTAQERYRTNPAACDATGMPIGEHHWN